jgi:hypothetical protein
MADALKTTINLSKILYNDAGALGFTNFTIDGTTDEAALVFQTEDAATITKVGFRVATITGTPGDLTISLQSLGATTGDPAGLLGSASVTIAATSLVAGQFNWVTLDASYAAGRGEFMAIKIDPTAGTWGASDLVVLSLALTGYNGRAGMPYASQAPSGVYARVAGYPIFAYGTASKVYGHPIDAVANTTYDSGTTPDELGMVFTLPAGWGATYKIKGVRILIGRPVNTGQSWILTLYSGTTALQTVTVDSEFYGTTSAGSGYRLYELFFDETSLTALDFGSAYRLAIAPQGANGDVTIPEFSVRSAADMQAFPLEESAYYAGRVDAGAWSNDVTTKRIFMEIFVDDITEPSGGGGGGAHSMMVFH